MVQDWACYRVWGLAMVYALVFLGTSLALMLFLSLFPAPERDRLRSRLGSLEGGAPEPGPAVSRIRARRKARRHRKELLSWLVRCGRYLLLGVGMLLLLAWSSRFRELAVLLAALGVAVSTLRHWQTRMVAWQLPPALERLAASLEQTSSFYGALEHVAKTAPWPISREFAHISRSLKRGETEERALGMFAKRHPLPEIEMFVSALGRTQQRGRRLGESLRMIQGMLEERRRSHADGLKRARPYRLAAWVLFATLLTLSTRHLNSSHWVALMLTQFERKGA